MRFKVDDCIFFQLAKASQAGARFWSGCVADMNITAVQAMVLNFLGQKDEITSRELGERTSLDSATLTGILDRLEASAFIERRRHPGDRRAIHVCLTEKGRGVADVLYKRAVEANKTFLSHLSSAEQTTLRRFLLTLRGKDIQNDQTPPN